MNKHHRNRSRSDSGAPRFWHIWEFFHRARLLIVIFSIVVPVVVISQNRVVRDRWDHSHPTKQAEKLIASGTVQATNASMLERACQDSPGRPDLLRALATACAESDPARARLCYEQIEHLGATTSGDIAGRAILMARLQSFADANAILDGAGSLKDSSPVLLSARLHVKILSGDTSGASVALEKLCKATEDDPDPALEAAEICASEGADRSIVGRAEGHAISVLSRWNEAGRKSGMDSRLAKLLDLPLQEASSREAAHVLMTKLPNPTPEQSVAAAVLARPAGFSGHEHGALRTAFIEACRRSDGMSSKEKEHIADFLQRQGEHVLVAELISMPESLTFRPLFRRRLSSLLHLGQWRGAAEMANDPAAPSAWENQQFFVILGTLGRTPDAASSTAELLLNAALREIGTQGSPEAFYSIGCAAAEKNFPDIAIEAFGRAVRLAPSDTQIIRNVISTSRRFGLPVKDLTAALSHALAGSSPGPLVAQRLCYLQLLAGDNLAAGERFIEEQKGHPADAVYLRFLDAFESHLHGGFPQSLRLLMPLPDYCWDQGETAVITGIICSAGDADQCAPLARNLDTAKLFPEERAIVEPWLPHLSLLGQNSPDIDAMPPRMAQR